MFAAGSLAIVPGPAVCDESGRTVRFHSVDTLRDTISAFRDPSGAIVINARGASKDDGYTRQDICPAIPGQPWLVVILSGDDGGDTIGVPTLAAEVKARLNGEGTVDTLEGHAGRDELRGGSAHDTMSGFEGDDELIDRDGVDEALGGRGDDVIKVDDGGRQADVVRCGSGRDLALADRVDRLSGCEKVR